MFLDDRMGVGIGCRQVAVQKRSIRLVSLPFMNEIKGLDRII